MEILHNDWAPLLNDQFQLPYYQRLREFLKREYNNQTVFPDMHNIYEAFHSTPFAETKVVILGQDPYHGPEQAHGFSFSVQPGIDIPPSLKNIFKELEADQGITAPNHGFLKSWAEQGVLLLNNVLTVRAHQAHSHQGKGWEQFTDKVIEVLNEREKPVVFILWGRHAQKKASFVDERKHFVIKSPHPSPLSAHRGFFGSRPFTKANRFLVESGEHPIDWRLPENPD
ncbi:uracil-DNA glycosylase [Thalassobacillus pellis]|uniref:uracil-DNA glycosylase n=1 Tax=Thalassobacillus pellis TaxID=748008 RepID=UPI0019604BE9|nr:uracil-DNA glycosylase [Thalassobacillus pellis]MBM7552538.1 uracil-DNA glycosylase [Thalassobacillus pellis]